MTPLQGHWAGTTRVLCRLFVALFLMSAGCEGSVCPTGYESEDDGTSNSCIDIDECTIGSHDCDANATCANTPGGFTCTTNLIGFTAKFAARQATDSSVPVAGVTLSVRSQPGGPEAVGTTSDDGTTSLELVGSDFELTATQLSKMEIAGYFELDENSVTSGDTLDYSAHPILLGTFLDSDNNYCRNALLMVGDTEVGWIRVYRSRAESTQFVEADTLTITTADGNLDIDSGNDLVTAVTAGQQYLDIYYTSGGSGEGQGHRNTSVYTSDTGTTRSYTVTLNEVSKVIEVGSCAGAGKMVIVWF